MVTIEQERELNSIASDKPTKVALGKGFVKVGWQKKGTLRKCSEIYLDERKDAKTEEKINSKIAALMVLNGFFRIRFFYSFLWRWYHYVRQYNDIDLVKVIEEGKKKVQLQEYYMATMLVQGLRDTQQTMTRDEVSRTLQELSSETKEQ